MSDLLTILIPLGSRSVFFDQSEYIFPKPLIEICNKSMIEHVIGNLQTIKGAKRFVFVIQQSDCTRYHLNEVLQLLAGPESKIVILDKGTQGAACTALMAIQWIGNTSELIISNGDQLIDTDLNKIIAQFRDDTYDAGVITFDTIHPRWSYIKKNAQGVVVEAAEKRPISRHAIAGFYYFRQGQDFVQAAMGSIEKGAAVDNQYYIAPTLNELILKGKKIGAVSIPVAHYHTFYSPKKIQEYEQGLR